MSDGKETVECPLCHERHEVMMMHGVKYVPCSEMPREMIMPASTLKAFMSGRSMLDEPFIIVR